MSRKFAGAHKSKSGMVMAAAAALALLLFAAPNVRAQVPLTQISSDPFTNSSSQHATQVEPDTYSYGSTIVATFQSGRFYDGGSSDIGFATSTNGGATWTHGFLPGITNVQNPGNPYDRDSDPSVAYDPVHGVWLISSLPIVDDGHAIPAVIVSRSTDGGLTWGNPVAVTGNVYDSDKDWIVCDTWIHSPHRGNCYVEWDQPSGGDYVSMNTSTDGGLTWGPTLHPQGGAYGLGGQPVVLPDGNVVVPFEGNSMEVFQSTDGGNSWSTATSISSISDHYDAGNIRSSPLPSAAVDAIGRVYVVWQDCRFRSGCAENDIVMSTSLDGLNWSSVSRIPIDATTSTVDHFIPAIDAPKFQASVSPTALPKIPLAVTYYYYPQTSCTVSTCQLAVGYISSTNGGQTWSAPIQVTDFMQLSWLPSTSLGYMVGDYISVSFYGNSAYGVFSVAGPNNGSVYNEATYTTASALHTPANGPTFSSAGEKPIPGAKSDHGPRPDQGERGPHPGPPDRKRLKLAKRG